MALLQISEPDASPAPHERRRAVGIDLGTTNSLVATVRNGIPVVLPDENGHPLLPSIVRYGEGGVDVGRAAQRRGIGQREAPAAVGDERRLAQLAQAAIDALASGAHQRRDVLLAERQVDQPPTRLVLAEVLCQLQQDTGDA